MKDMKTYVLTVSEYFPKTHSRKGENSFFPNMILSALDRDDLLVDKCFQKPPKKLHTIRGNYPLWEKRFEEIEKGNACLSVRKWTGKPYNSKQEEIIRLAKEDGIGIQKLQFMYNIKNNPEVNGNKYPSISELSKNDGLSRDDFQEWFKSYDISESMAIIHFTKFRY